MTVAVAAQAEMLVHSDQAEIPARSEEQAPVDCPGKALVEEVEMMVAAPASRDWAPMITVKTLPADSDFHNC